jgi:hypothetical protein
MNQFNLFIFEFQKFVHSTANPGSILTTKILKGWIRNLDVTHPLKTTFTDFKKTTEVDYDEIVYYMKYLKGYYQSIAYKRRIGYGAEVKVINVMQNKIKV